MEPVSRTPTKPVDYAALSAGYGALLGAVLLASRDKGAHPVRETELPALGLATFALSKLVSKEKVESWVRRPFVHEEDDGARRPKGRRLRYATGELLTCSRCVGAWSALGLVGLRVARPAESRVVTSVLAAGAINDWLQAGFARLCAETDVSRARATSAGDEPRPRLVRS